MKEVVILGGGFLARNLAAHLRRRNDCRTVVREATEARDHLIYDLAAADIVYHLATLYRAADSREFERFNAEFTEWMCQTLRRRNRYPKIIFESSAQAVLGNPYGVSKLRAEVSLKTYAAENQATVRIYRLKGMFGKWCPPDHNSVTATFCHNIANDLPIVISDPSVEVELNYVDDIMAAFVAELDEGTAIPEIPATCIRLDRLAGQIQALHDICTTVAVPDLSEPFGRALLATYRSYLPPAARHRCLISKADARGSLAELVKSSHLGQVFVSRTAPGVTRGNHYHHTKTETFFVVEGEGLIRMRPIDGPDVVEYAVTGREFEAVDIPPGYTHSITNTGRGEMITLFWSSEVFNPDRPDTYYLPVDEPSSVVRRPRV